MKFIKLALAGVLASAASMALAIPQDVFCNLPSVAQNAVAGQLPFFFECLGIYPE